MNRTISSPPCSTVAALALGLLIGPAGPWGCAPTPAADLTTGILPVLDTTPAWTSAEADRSFAIDWGDWDDDGDLDLAVANFGEANEILENEIGSLTAGRVLAGSGESTSFHWGDWDGDGDLDLAVANFNDPNRVFENNDGVMSQVWESVETDPTFSVAWGDVDGDGDLDLAVGNKANASSGRNRVYENDGGTLTLAWTGDEAMETRSVAWADIDGDGDLDLATGNCNEEVNHVHVNGGSGDASTALEEVPSWTSAESESTYDIAFGDVDGDGDLDLAAANKDEMLNRVYVNDDGTLVASGGAVTTDAEDSQAVAWGDVDGDGDLDLAVANGSHEAVGVNRVYANDGGTFTALWEAATADYSKAVAWADWDLDEDLDLLFANHDDHNVLYVNEQCPDFDDDGWTTCDGDCNDDDDAVHPEAEEIAGDGVDSDCDGSDDPVGDDDDTVDDDDCAGDDDTVDDDDDDSGEVAPDERLYLCACRHAGHSGALPGAALLALTALGTALALRRRRGALLLVVLLGFAASSPAMAQEDLDPAAEEAFFEGNGLLAEGHAAEALEAYDRALALEPGLYRAHLYSARAWLDLGDADRAEDSAHAFEQALGTDAERTELDGVLQRIEQLRGEGSVTPPPPQDRARLVISAQGAYAMSSRATRNHWGLAQVRADVRVWSGLHARIGFGLGLQAEAGHLYGVLPVELGVTWRFGTLSRPVPFVDAHLLLVWYDDGLGNAGREVSGEVAGVGIGGGAGGGVEIPLARGRAASLALAPEFHVGWAGVLLLHAGAGVRLAF